MKLKGNDVLIKIAKNFFQMGLAHGEVSEIVNFPMDVISVIEIEPLKKTDVISIDFGAIKYL